jgi:hypothetical protein
MSRRTACASKEDDMITLDSTTQLTTPLADRAGPDEAELAAISFLMGLWESA